MERPDKITKSPWEGGLYGYALNSPVNFIDPTGQGIFGDILDVVKGAVEIVGTVAVAMNGRKKRRVLLYLMPPLSQCSSVCRLSFWFDALETASHSCWRLQLLSSSASFSRVLNEGEKGVFNPTEVLCRSNYEPFLNRRA